MDEKELGSLATWPDDRLATSLYECGSRSLSGGSADWATHYGELLTTFPKSGQSAKVETAVGTAVDKAVKDVGGDDPCAAVERLDSLNSQIVGLPAERAGQTEALGRTADRAERNAESGTYACGVDQYKEKSFAEAVTTMNDFVKNAGQHKNAARAKKIAIAAEVAQTVPAAGKRLPTTASGGSISVTVKNDSPDDITVLYTGPVTGSFTLKACGKCTSYSLASTVTLGFEPCSDSGRNYPQRTIRLPVGTTYFVHKSKSGIGNSCGLGHRQTVVRLHLHRMRVYDEVRLLRSTATDPTSKGRYAPGVRIALIPGRMRAGQALSAFCGPGDRCVDSVTHWQGGDAGPIGG